MTKKALGRGLDALINGGIVRSVVAEPPHVEVAASVTSRPAVVVPLGVSSSAAASAVAAADPSCSVRSIAIDDIEPSRFQPRTAFDPEQLRELADSIRQRGVVQPLLVRPLRGAKDGRYELIAGERRWRAAREAGLATLPVLVREATDQEVLEIALIENLQREDLNPIEEAHGYQQLVTQFQLTQEQVAEKVGRSRAAVANALRLLALPGAVQSWVAQGLLSVGHAKAILGLPTAAEQQLVAERVLKRHLTVRQTEQLVEQLKGDGKIAAGGNGRNAPAPHVAVLEERLRQKLGTQVRIQHGKKKGRIEIEYYGTDDLQRLLGLLGIDNL